MRVKSPKSPRTTALAASVVVMVAMGFGVTAAPWASAASQGSKPTRAPSAESVPATPDKGFYDARSGGTPAAQSALARSAAAATSRPATERLRASLGDQAVVDMDGLTGTPRQLSRLDGFLTGPSNRPATAVALGYVRAHLSALGLTQADLKTFQLSRNWVDIAGIHHVAWTQSAGGVPVFGNGLAANVTKHGQLLSLFGSPVSGLRAPAAQPTKISSSDAAIAAARADVGETTAAGPADTARRVLFVTPTGTQLGWESITMSASRPMLTVIDSVTGQVLYRSDLGADETAPAVSKHAKGKSTESTGLAHLYFPNHKPRGGDPIGMNFTKRGWLSGHAKVLSGNNSHTYSDVNDDNKPNASEEVHAKTPHHWNYRLQPFNLKHVSFCDNPWPCSWNPNKPYSWKVNRAQNATQVFSFVNNWHDHLMKSPIGFNEAAGNFQKVNTSGKGHGQDAVQTQTDDGANSAHGLPDGGHIDNANMSTPPDGRAPRMQMYLQHAPYTSYPNGDPFSPTNVGDEADTVYHEYTHGLSNRLVVDPSGRSTLGGVQAGSMGEAWSDWYAMDYLVDQKLQTDVKNKVDVVMFQYDGAGVAYDRTEPVDCKVGDTSPKCNGGATSHSGGYTYADYGKVVGFPEVHSDGEIWAQTLWDLRAKLGSRTAESLVTRAMSLSPSNPSFLDERNAILLADMATTGGAHQDTIWKVFAHRGMGYFAGSFGGNDTEPGASFELPPTNNATGSISGTVTDSVSGDPIEGATVTVAFEGSPFVINPTVTTAVDGTYSLGPIPQGTYPKVTIAAPGFDGVTAPLTVDQPGVTQDAALDRDWAASSGGASVDSFTGPTYPWGCGPKRLIDQSPAQGWETSTQIVGGVAGPKTAKNVVIKLPVAVDLSSIQINPSAICADGQSAGLGSYTVETSSNGTDYTEVASGEFTKADDGHANTVTLTPGPALDDVSYIRVWNNSPKVLSDSAEYPDGCTVDPNGYSGCSYEDIAEVAVYGLASP